jgi:hypothetical protein
MCSRRYLRIADRALGRHVVHTCQSQLGKQMEVFKEQLERFATYVYRRTKIRERGRMWHVVVRACYN